MKEERSSENKEQSREPLLWSRRHDVRRDHSLNSRVGNMPIIRRDVIDENNRQCGVNMDRHCLARKMNDGCTKLLVNPQGQGLLITKAQGMHLVGV
jgi:hypothetical protein